MQPSYNIQWIFIVPNPNSMAFTTFSFCILFHFLLIVAPFLLACTLLLLPRITFLILHNPLNLKRFHSKSFQRFSNPKKIIPTIRQLKRKKKKKSTKDSCSFNIHYWKLQCSWMSLMKKFVINNDVNRFSNGNEYLPYAIHSQVVWVFFIMYLLQSFPMISAYASSFTKGKQEHKWEK